MTLAVRASASTEIGTRKSPPSLPTASEEQQEPETTARSAPLLPAKASDRTAEASSAPPPGGSHARRFSPESLAGIDGGRPSASSPASAATSSAPPSVASSRALAQSSACRALDRKSLPSERRAARTSKEAEAEAEE